MAFDKEDLRLLERDLRQRLRDEWAGPELAWVENGRGGTVGLPDVFVPLLSPRLYLPVELKVWDIVVGRIKFEARPAQLRFHKLTARNGMRSAFVALLIDGSVIAVPGKFMPDVNYPFEIPKVWRIEKSLDELARIFNNEQFWKGGKL